jgi:ribosome assembly protein SQT1
MTWHPKGAVLVAGGADSTVWMWQRACLPPQPAASIALTSHSFWTAPTVPSGNTMQVFAGHTDSVSAVAWTPDGALVEL